MKFSWRDITIWHFYLLIFTIYTSNKTTELLNPNSAIFQYYNILLGYKFYHAYIFQYAQCGLEIIALIPLTLFVFKIKKINLELWRAVLVLRFIANLFSHSYDFKIIDILTNHRFIDGILTTTQLLTMYIPSFIACYIYAFESSKKNST